ncbi:short chain dehydrogenase [Blastomyces gilchristii SLH14081]|uniref:Short chain dehydrogenase n=1 Tax=Blastomyces gilchristii (strain SLH14081) TaxID=559298 RepID=A0A179UHC4_BLAGS|nr:short chain dehydrogenase [Blastomyces gilchristii SLH14081]OAT07153.1 short chain dehydrogenase [Blastomyces gilchristii SLH14081]
MSARLQGKVAVITGSSNGIGRGIALRYAAEGAYVVCSDLDPAPKGDGDKPTHEAINETYPVVLGSIGATRAVFVKADASVSDDVETLVKECVKAFGRLDIMVNNAGMTHAGHQTAGARIHETPEGSWDRVMGLNGKGVWLGCKFAAKHMLAQDPHPSGDRGWIINMASVYGSVGAASSSTYSASKHAVVGITKSVALEYAKDRIHVNALAPGWVETGLIKPFADAASENPLRRAFHAHLVSMHPFDARLGREEDITGAAVFLASDDARWMTGTTLAVDGGYVAH